MSDKQDLQSPPPKNLLNNVELFTFWLDNEGKSRISWGRQSVQTLEPDISETGHSRPLGQPRKEGRKEGEELNGGSEGRGRPSPGRAGANMAALAPALAAAAGRLQVKAAGTRQRPRHRHRHRYRYRALRGAPECTGVPGWPRGPAAVADLAFLCGAVHSCVRACHSSLQIRARAALKLLRSRQ